MVNAEFVRMLEDSGIPDADFDVKCMMEQITGSRFASSLNPEQKQQLLDMIQQRINGEPLQYILGEWEFYGLKLFVGNGVLIPRPETELLVDIVLDWCRNRKIHHIIDLCTGSGCIALALKKHLPDVKVSAVDISREALSYARKNAEYHHLAIDFYHADVLDRNFAEQAQNADIIVSNPPYLTSAEMQELQTEVRHEPALALFGGGDGLDYYQTVTNLWKSVLHSGGMLAYEIGWKQGISVSKILKSNHFGDIQVFQDYEHRDRVVTGKNF